MPNYARSFHKEIYRRNPIRFPPIKHLIGSTILYGSKRNRLSFSCRQAPRCSIPVALECFRRSSSLEERNICRGMHGQIGKCSNSTDSGASKCLRCSLNGHGNGGRMQSILGWLFEKQLIFV